MFNDVVANSVLRFNCIRMNHYGPARCLIFRFQLYLQYIIGQKWVITNHLDVEKRNK
jgi:hypothetical protein